MTSPQNISRLSSLLPDGPLDDRLPDQVVHVEVDADHDARDQHDNRSLDHLGLTGPIDFLQLCPRLREEAAALAALRPRLALGGGRARADLRLARAGALRDAALILRLRLATGAPLRSRLAGH